MPIEAPPELIPEAQDIYPIAFNELVFQGETAITFNAIMAQSSSGSPDDPNFALSPEDAEANPRYLVFVNLEWDEDEPGGKVLSLRSLKMDTRALLSFQLPYLDETDLMNNMAFFVWNFSATMPRDEPPELEPEPPPEDWAWKNKWLYISFQGIAAPGFYTNKNRGLNALGWALGGGIGTEFQFLHWYWPRNYLSLSFQGGVNLMIDTLQYRTVALDLEAENGIRAIPSKADTQSLLLPLLLRVNYKPGGFALSLCGGVYYILPLASTGTIDPPLSITAGIKAGVKTRPREVLSLNIQFSQDLGPLSLPGDLPLQFQRSSLFVGVSYEFGFFDRKVK
jgi:hypothetical protein